VDIGGNMKHIVSFSGGKDSTAMLLRMLEEDMTIDDIIFCDVGKDFPDMIDHVGKVKKYIKEKYNKDITIVKADKSFDYYMFDHIKTRGKNKGEKGYGWANMRIRWCTSMLKNKAIDDYLKKYKEEGYIEYIGIAVDEPKRVKDKIYPLVEWGMTEKDCLQYCYDRGFNWNGLYEHFDRVSCWCCPLKNLKELKTLYIHYPDLWEELKDMDKRAYNQFRKDYSVEQLEEKFAGIVVKE
jgi:3'-phosphoadenosine 5'-phosphosulfate sulfotransferase (PAPS reductase)/FAD synthetase